MPLLRRWQLTVPNYFAMYSKTFPNGGPPKDSFIVADRGLRREYKQLQSQAHPDRNQGDDTELTLINQSYRIISNPYTRLCHLISLNHPHHIDLSQDDVAKQLIAKFQNKSPENLMEYKNMLMSVLDAHEGLEMATSETEVEELDEENNARIEECEEEIEQLIKHQWPPQDWDELMMLAIRMKYWVNIENACKEWEPGKPVHLTH